MIKMDDMISKITNPFSKLSTGEGEASAIRSTRDGVHPEVDAKLEKAVSDFESIFIYQMLKGMRNNVMKSELFGDGKTEEIYTSMLDQELSTIMSKDKGMGLKEMLLRQFSPDTLGSDATRGLPGEEGERRMLPVKKPGAAAIREFEAHMDAPKGAAPEASKMDTNFKSPVRGRISSPYGMRTDPYTGESAFHKGTDIAAPEGTPIYPTMDGKVIFSGKRGGYGNVVEIKHENGYISRYAHNRKNLVNTGDLVSVREKIAEVGSSGRSTGPHLHLEFRVEGMAVNPNEMVDFG